MALEKEFLAVQLRENMSGRKKTRRRLAAVYSAIASDTLGDGVRVRQYSLRTRLGAVTATRAPQPRYPIPAPYGQA